MCLCDHLLLQLINVGFHIPNLSFQCVSSISAVFQCAVVVLDGPLESTVNRSLNETVFTDDGQQQKTVYVCVLTAASSRDLLSPYSCVHAIALAFRLPS